MSVKCPKCNLENPSDSEFCKECGTRLISKEGIAIHTKTLQTPIRGKIMDVDVGEIIDEKYELLEELGSGGMGVVYKAKQKEPVKRDVALKIIKLGMDTQEVVARFEMEKQALAVMTHPNIAKVHDAGATKGGRPYFVMELVSGIPITDYCDKHKLSTRERLELFIPVCEAVQHAHQKGVIHRDLKPSNVLVEILEDKPIPKIIDFGISRATEHSLTERTLFTERGQLIGTPEYMSPEQAEMSGLDVDTRTDIYSLGVMLYELLVGALPFDSKKLRSAGFGEIQRIIREEEPPQASTRLNDLADNQTIIAKQRRTDVASLLKQLKGDLDWITMKAMEKDRTRRYSAVSDLAADITRHLKKEPIIARPPSRIYNIGKFVRRHKVGVTAAALVVTAMILGITGTTLGLLNARRAKETAQEEAKIANQVSDFLVNLFSEPNPYQARGREVTASEILDKGAAELKESLKDQPIVQARLMRTVGHTYIGLGLYQEAESLLLQALETHRALLGNESQETLTSILALGNLYWFWDRVDKAEPLYKELVDTQNRLFGEEHQNTIGAKITLTALYSKQQRWQEMEALGVDLLEVSERVNGKEHHITLAIMNNLQGAYYGLGRYAEAEELAARVLEIEKQKYGEDHPYTLLDMHNLATIYDKQDKFDLAESLYIDTIQLRVKVLGKDHPDATHTIFRLGEMYMRQKRYFEAEEKMLSVYQVYDKKFGKDHAKTQDVLKKLIELYNVMRIPEKASYYSGLLKDETQDE